MMIIITVLENIIFLSKWQGMIEIEIEEYGSGSDHYKGQIIRKKISVLEEIELG